MWGGKSRVVYENSSVHLPPPPPFLLGELNFLPNFQKGGAGGNVGGGGGTGGSNITNKQKLKSEIFNDKKSLETKIS